MNVGLRKRASFSAIRTKNKARLDMLPCVSKQLPIAEETPLNNTWMKQGEAVQLVFQMKENSTRAILK